MSRLFDHPSPQRRQSYYADKRVPKVIGIALEPRRNVIDVKLPRATGRRAAQRFVRRVERLTRTAVSADAT